MTTRYIDPLSAAYVRMKSALFKPFNFETWLVLGFASWISGWSTGSSYNYNFRLPADKVANRGSTPEDVMGSFFQDLVGLWADPVWRATLIAGPILLVALVVVLLWVNARGEFVFLDAVLNKRHAIVEPWHAWRTQGNSLFVWRLVFSLIMLAAFAIVLCAILLTVSGGHIPRSVGEFRWLRFLIGLAAVWVPFAIVGIYVHVWLRHFVTPIMFRDRVTTTEAWRTFLPILRERLGAFVCYGLFLFVVQIGLLIALIPAILLTCCLLGCLLVLPYVGAVVWLPVSYSFRGFGPEFLAQFGPAYDVWPRPVTAAEPDLPQPTDS